MNRYRERCLQDIVARSTEEHNILCKNGKSPLAVETQRGVVEHLAVSRYDRLILLRIDKNGSIVAVVRIFQDEFVEKICRIYIVARTQAVHKILKKRKAALAFSSALLFFPVSWSALPDWFANLQGNVNGIGSGSTD